MAAKRAKLKFDAMIEYVITDELAGTNPRAVPAVGWPLLLAMKLVRA